MRLIDVLSSPWAIVPEKLTEIHRVYRAHARGERIDLAELEAKLGEPLQRKVQGYQLTGSVAVIPIDGIIVKRANLLTNVSGAASSELIARDIAQALGDPKVESIVLQIDSPGGSVDGTQALAGAVRAAAKRKRVIAFADGMMASAAYWIGCAAERVVISGDTAYVGSIGVVASHIDISRYEANVGIKTTEIYAGKFKRIASEYEPLKAAGREYIQAMVDQLYSVFVSDVAKYRGSTVDHVLAKMADGRIFIGRQAIAAGLADRVSTLEELIGSLSTRQVATEGPAMTATQSHSSATVEARCHEAWLRDATVRAEYLTLEAYTAYERRQAARRA